MKRIVALLLAALLALSASACTPEGSREPAVSPPAASEGAADGSALTNGEIYVNGQRIEGPAPSVTGSDGVILLPLEGIAEALGYSVEVDAQAKTATIRREWGDISLTAGQAAYTVSGGEPVEFGPAPMWIDDHFYVPVSFFEGVLKGCSASIGEDGSVRIAEKLD
ncbi:MAG: copper amine oxidase N-terminal domain-containing protein [Christensenellaceae bacterium]|nr:copper amine oxidase N-terminal domain-containing protein [Christensenellaceae bacterium]